MHRPKGQHVQRHSGMKIYRTDGGSSQRGSRAKGFRVRHGTGQGGP